jgi:hypothetical protein
LIPFSGFLKGVKLKKLSANKNQKNKNAPIEEIESNQILVLIEIVAFQKQQIAVDTVLIYLTPGR